MLVTEQLFSLHLDLFPLGGGGGGGGGRGGGGGGGGQNLGARPPAFIGGLLPYELNLL